MRIVGAVLLASAVWAGMARAEPRLDIVQILEQFVTAEMAAKLCGASAVSGDLFAKNRLAVTVRATQALIERNPGLPPDEVKAREATMIAKLVDATSTLVQRRGCSDPDVALLIKRYEIQSRVDLAR